MSFLNNLNWRYATKKFDPNKKINSQDLQTIRDSIRLAPTSNGLQLFKVIELTNPEIRQKIRSVSFDQSQITDGDRVFVFARRSDMNDRIDKMFFEKYCKTNNLDIAFDSNLVNPDEAGYKQFVKDSIKSKTQDEIFELSGRQAYIALGFAMAACAELHIDSCPMEGFNDPLEIKQILGLSDEFIPVAFLVVGYRSQDDQHASNPKWRFAEDEIITKM